MLAIRNMPLQSPPYIIVCGKTEGFIPSGFETGFDLSGCGSEKEIMERKSDKY